MQWYPRANQPGYKIAPSSHMPMVTLETPNEHTRTTGLFGLRTSYLDATYRDWTRAEVRSVELP